MALTLVKFILAKVELDRPIARQLFKSAKSGNLDFLQNATFAQVNPLLKQILTKMLVLNPKTRISSVEILSMMKVAIPIVSEHELAKARSLKPVGSFKLKTSFNRTGDNKNCLGKRARVVLDTPEVHHDMFYSNIKDSFAFPVLDTSTKAQNVAQSLSSAGASGSHLKRLKSGHLDFKPDQAVLSNLLKKHKSHSKKANFCKGNKSLKPTFAIRPKRHASKFGFESLLPFSLQWSPEDPARDIWARVETSG